MDARYAEPLDVATLARAARLSPAHFSREFRREFGETPHQYLLTRRLERAAALLRNTDRSVAEVCMMVGLRSVGSFTTSFGRVYGMTPTAYRAAHPPAVLPSPDSDLHPARQGRQPSSRFREDSATRRRDLRALDRNPPGPGDHHAGPAHHVNVWVHDQDEALDFYTKTLGMEIRDDVTIAEMGDFRWLTVAPPGQAGVALALLNIPGPPCSTTRPPRRSGRWSRRAPPAACSSSATTCAAPTRS